jgi:hypothetical protein
MWKRIGCILLLLGAVAFAPFLLLAGLWILGGGNHRTVEHRTLSPDGRHEVRLQNDVRGSIQPVDWIVYVKRADTRSDDPEVSCAVADITGEDGWRAVEPVWRQGSLELRYVPRAATMPLERGLVARKVGCAPFPIEVIPR